MAYMLHSVTLDFAPEAVFGALTTKDGLRGWWTSLASCVDAEVGGFVRLPFDKNAITYIFKIKHMDPYRYIEWKTREGADEWKGTLLRFEIESLDGRSILNFAHEDWKEETPFFAVCNTTWGHLFYDSLPRYLARGKGFPIS